MLYKVTISLYVLPIDKLGSDTKQHKANRYIFDFRTLK